MDEDETLVSLYPSANELLDEIQSESLQQLLTEVRHDAFPIGGTKIAPFDDYLTSFSSRPLSRGDIIEIQGPSGSGKTHLVYQLIQTCVLPDVAYLSGWGKAAIVFDADGTFDVRRLRTLLEHAISSAMERTAYPQGPRNTARILHDALERVRVLRPASTLQLAASLHHLEQYVTTDPRLQRSEVALVVVDSISAFYWPDRFTVEQYRYAPREERRHVQVRNPFVHVVSALQRIKTSLKPVIVLTNWALNVAHHPDILGDNSPVYKQHMRPFIRFSNEEQTAAPHARVAASVGPLATLTAINQEDETEETTSRIPELPSLAVDYHLSLWPTTDCTTPAPETDNSSNDSGCQIRVLVHTAGKDSTGEFSLRIGERAVTAMHEEVPSPAPSFLSYEDPP